jgi:FkbM family methyltransferase
MKYNHEIAKQNIRMNGLKKRFKLYNFAISDIDETLYFDSLKSNSDNTNNFFFKEKIKAKNISNFFKNINNLDLIFLDIEGMESKIIPHILNKNLNKIKFIFIELHGDKILSKFNSSNKEIYQLLIKHKFKLNVLNKKKFLNFKNIKIPTNRHYLICTR